MKFKIRPNTDDRFYFKDIWLNNVYLQNGIVISDNDIVIDIGANIGFFSIYASILSKNGTIYSFEPEPKNFDLLKMNIQLNEMTNIIPLKKAVAGKNGKKDLYLSNNKGQHSLFPNNKRKNSIKVDSISLLNIVNEYKISNIDFLKLDCEGAEYDILLNCPDKVFDIIKTISMKCHEVGDLYNENTLIPFLEKRDFKVKIKKNDECRLFAKKN